MSRQPSLTARMAALLNRTAFALDVLPELIPNEKRDETDKESPRSGFQPSAVKMATEARALVAEYQNRSAS